MVMFSYLRIEINLLCFGRSQFHPFGNKILIFDDGLLLIYILFDIEFRITVISKISQLNALMNGIFTWKIQTTSLET